MYFSQNSKGFAIDYELADELEVLDEFLIWEEECDEAFFRDRFYEKYGIMPSGVKMFEYGTFVKELEGFEYDSIYVLFDGDNFDDLSKQKWKDLIETLENQDIVLSDGAWKEIECC